MPDPPEPEKATDFTHEDFVEVFTEHWRRIYRFILSLTANRADTDDVFQSTSVVLYKKFGEFDPSVGTFYSWACRIAYLEVLNMRRSRRRDTTLSSEVLELLSSETLKRSRELDTREEALEDCIKKLPQQHRRLIEDRYYHEYTAIQLAERSQRSVHAVYRSLAKVHGLLRRCVDRTLLTEGH